MIKMAEIRKNGKIKKVLFMVLLLSFMFLEQNPEIQEEIQNTENIRENLVVSPLTAEVHSEIKIIGNTELASFCAGNGTDGSSWANAHMIKDYAIDASGSGSAIEIRDTTLHLIIQNCTVTNSGSGSSDAGIYLDNCTNVKITGCNASNNYNGLYLYNSNNNSISGNLLSDNTNYGISLKDGCENNAISGNNASDNVFAGISLDSNCNNNTISRNNVSDNTYDGIYLDTNSNNNTISGNNASSNEKGIYLNYNCSNNTISGNNASSNEKGIYLESNCNDNIISSNNASYNTNNGIELAWDCLNNIISSNSISDNNYGIYLRLDCLNNIISSNSISDNNNGIYLYQNCDNNTLSGNDVSYNVWDGIYLETDCDYNTISGNNVSYNLRGLSIEENLEDNTIWMNFFSNNSQYQGGSDISSNWDNGTLGNYWGDFREKYPDATSSNGIWWDCEYEVDPGYNDTRPLVHPGFPEISSSANVAYMIGDVGNEISWTISDSTILDPTYWIYLDGVEIQKGLWGSGGIISIDVDESSVGTDNYVLKCNDGTAWGWKESHIVVTVAEIPKPVLITTSQTISTESITVEWSEVVGINSYNVYVNGTLTNSTGTLEQNIWLNETGTYSITVTAINGAEESEHSDAITIIVLIDDSNNNLFWYLFGGGGLLVVGFIGIAFVKIKMKK